MSFVPTNCQTFQITLGVFAVAGLGKRVGGVVVTVKAHLGHRFQKPLGKHSVQTGPLFPSMFYLFHVGLCGRGRAKQGDQCAKGQSQCGEA